MVRTAKDPDPDPDPVQSQLHRRRALRVLGALAAAAGVAALNAARPEEAQGAATTDTAIWYSATVSQITALTGGTATIEGDNTGNGPGVKGTSATDVGVFGEGGTGSTSFGVHGSAGGTLGGQVPSFQVGVVGACDSTAGAGVSGSSHGASAFGVWGYADGANGIGVHGESQISSGIGVQGLGNGGTGVLGQSNNHIGVWGVTTNSGQGLANPAVAGSNMGGGAGLVGFTAGPGSIGLGGATDVGIGAYGSSQTGVGLYGFTNNGIGINGISVGNGYAGFFNGPVFIAGSMTATGAKSAAVKTKSGLSRVYRLECPESWFEDFGSSQLTTGQATVSLEPGFASIVHTNAYRVFLTPRGECNGLYISSQSGGGYTVRELHNGTSDVAFDYRVVAKRADIEGARLEHVDQPQPIAGPQEPVLDRVPKPPANQAPAPLQMPGAGGSSPGH
jgi:hypothetical protein